MQIDAKTHLSGVFSSYSRLSGRWQGKALSFFDDQEAEAAADAKSCGTLKFFKAILTAVGECVQASFAEIVGPFIVDSGYVKDLYGDPVRRTPRGKKSQDSDSGPRLGSPSVGVLSLSVDRQIFMQRVAVMGFG